MQKKFYLFFCFFFVFLFYPLYAESSSSATQQKEYKVTETQLQTLEAIQTTQNQLIADLKEQLSSQSEQLKNLKTQTESLKEYSKKLEDKVLIRNSIISVTAGISAGCIAGLISYYCAK